jgi:hypothetical protein
LSALDEKEVLEVTGMRRLVILFSLLSLPTVFVVSAQTLTSKPSLKETSIVGRWHVKFTLLGGEEKNLDLIAKEHGVGAFELKDTGPDNKPVPTPQPAIWSTTSDTLSISSNVELPIGTCCRENGTLIFKAKVVAGNSFSGKLIFVTNTDEEESPYKFRSTIGTFSATRLAEN